MSNVSVAIYDYDRSQTITVTERVMSINTTETLDSPGQFNAQLKGITETHALDDITVTYGSETLFLGTIEAQTDELRGGSSLLRYSSWSGTDRSLRLNNRVVNRIYENKTVAEILADILTRYPCGVSLGPITQSTPLVERIDWPYVSLVECVQQLADISGFRWYIDTSSVLHFFDTDEGTGATVFSTTTAGGLVRNIKRDTIELTTEVNDKTANRVWVIGAQSAAPQFTEQYWTGDGQNDIFTVAFTPSYPEVYENGVKKTIEVEKHGNSDRDYTYAKKEKVLRRVAGPLPAGVTVRFRYRPTVQIIDYFEDTASINKYGIYEKAVKDKQITEKMAARARGRAELKRRSSEIRTLRFEALNHDVKRGLRYRIVIPEFAIDSYWLCKSVTTDITRPDTINVRKTVEMEEIRV